LRRDLGRRQDRPEHRRHRRPQRPASRGGEWKRRDRPEARHRMPGRQRPAGRTARRHLHALRDARVRVTGITLYRFVRRLARWGAAIALIILGLVLSVPGIPGPGLLIVLLGVFVLLPESRWLRKKYVALARRYPKLFHLVEARRARARHARRSRHSGR